MSKNVFVEAAQSQYRGSEAKEVSSRLAVAYEQETANIIAYANLALALGHEETAQQTATIAYERLFEQ